MEPQPEMALVTVQLPERLSEAFQSLRKGRHICRADGPVWFDLREQIQSYRTVFGALGYTLANHPRGFYYFSEGQQARPDVLSRLVYFFTCFFADLDQGRYIAAQVRWVDTLTDQRFDLASISQNMFSANDRQRVFDQLQVQRDNFDKAVIAPLYRYGICSKPDNGSIRFRESVYRFVELFLICGEDTFASHGVPASVSDSEMLNDAPAQLEERENQDAE